MDNLFSDAFGTLLAERCTPDVIRAIEAQPQPAHPLWSDLQASGFADALVPETQGGAGLTLVEACPLIELCGEHALPYPYAETLLARAWLAQAGLALPAGAIAWTRATQGPDGHFAHGVRGARLAESVLVACGSETRLLPLSAVRSEPDIFPLDARLHWPRAVWDAAPLVPAAGGADALQRSQAPLYAALIAGALRHVFARTLRYANERQQFGKPIGKFQAIQHQLSVMSEHVFAARMAAQLAYAGTHSDAHADSGSGAHAHAHADPRTRLSFDPLRAAIAKARTSEAALEVAALSHSIHGAIGFTAEYDLQLYTRRLHLWRQTAGAESYWHDQIGAAALAHNGPALDLIRQATDMTVT